MPTARSGVGRTRPATVGRRAFLGLAAGGAAWAVAGCSDDTTDDGRDQPTATTAPVGLELGTDPFTLGVASGDPTPDAVVLWTRLAPAPTAPDGGMPDDDVEVGWEVATNPSFDGVIASGSTTATADHGHSVHVDVTGLAPATDHWYRFTTRTHTSPVARTRTLPQTGADVERFVIAMASCQLRQSGHWTAHRLIAEDEPDMVLHLGDYVYEYFGGGEDLAVPLEAEPETIEDYRVLYGVYKSDPHLQASHAVAPWLVTWDDHEVQNNYASAVPSRDTDPERFAARRAAAYRAYWEHMPLRSSPDDDGGLRLHRRVEVGSLATFFVLDGRQHRSDQVCGDEVPTLASECAELDDPDATMLGADQERWLDGGLADAATTWKVLAQQTVVKALTVGDLVPSVDQWDGYPAARRRLLGSVEEHGVDNVVILTGDIHAGAAAEIRGPDAGATGPVLAHEMVVPAISSPPLGEAAEVVDPQVLGLSYLNARENGYARAVLTAESWTTEWVTVEVVDPDGGSRVDAVRRVDAGTPGLVTP